MNLDKFTEKARESIADSQKLAARLNHQKIDVEHVLLGVLDAGFYMVPAAQWETGSSPILHEDVVIVLADVQKLTVNSKEGDDSLTVELNNVNPIPTGSLVIDGTAGASGRIPNRLQNVSESFETACRSSWRVMPQTWACSSQ